jgi:rare lipoprotein A
MAGGVTPRERALILAGRLRNFAENNGNPWKIFPDFSDGLAVIKYEDEILLTADVKSAKSMGLDVSELALNWANSIRRSFGATELIKDYDLIKVISDKYDEIIGYYETGVASWYGGYFHGRTAADGSIYNMYQFTAAHKTLPFGSVVKVTNLKNGNACIVKITDRGPFIDGRIIDLSKVAAEEIGMLNSGVSKVKIEVIGKV